MNLDRTVALKMILSGQRASEDEVRRFYQEAEAAANLQHPGIVSICEIGQHEGQHFFSMAHLLADGPLLPREATKVVQQVAEATAYAHAQGVVHRDLKPPNILTQQGALGGKRILRSRRNSLAWANSAAVVSSLSASSKRHCSRASVWACPKVKWRSSSRASSGCWAGKRWKRRTKPT